MAHSVLLRHRFLAPVETLDRVRDHISPPHRVSWLRGGRIKIAVSTWLGVPGKLGDVAIPAHPQPFSGCPLAVDLSHKEGCYDGAVRWRVTLRWWPESTRAVCPPTGKLLIEEHSDPETGAATELALIATWAGGGFWNLSLPRLPYTVDPRTDPVGIVMHQWRHYYQHLREEDARPIAEAFVGDVPDWASRDINELNRFASRLLYAQSRALGWRKLTLQEKRRHGIAGNAPQWIRADSPLLRNALVSGHPSGCGQYTLDAANGQPIRTAYGAVGVED